MNNSICKKSSELDPREFGLTAGQLFAAARCFYPDADPRRHRLLDSPLSATEGGV